MSDFYGYPENDWRNYIEHTAARGSSKSHKYISKHKSKLGNWVYVYPKQTRTKKANAVLRELDRRTELEDKKLDRVKETLDWMGSLKPEDFSFKYNPDPELSKAAYEDMANAHYKMTSDWIDRDYKNNRLKKKRKILSKIFSKTLPR